MKKILWLIIIDLLFHFPFSLHAEERTIYAVVIGISNYWQLPSLNLPDRDARMMAELYKKQTKHVILLTNKYATKNRILTSLRQQFARARKEDMVVFFFSGHGYAGGICPYDMTRDAQSGISYEDIQAILKETKADKKVVFADACFSGGFRLDDTHTSIPLKDNLDILFFLSSRTGESSIEMPFMTNGIFTTYLVRGLRGGADVDGDRRITAKELFHFVSYGVVQKSQEKQHPVMWGNFADNYVVLDWISSFSLSKSIEE